MNDDQILHVIVGHGLPTMYINTLNSFRAVCPQSRLLVIDNCSPQAWLRAELQRRAAADPHMELVLRTDNHLSDPKVGALYRAYTLAFDRARSDRYRYVHLVQADMQCMFWDQDLLDKLQQLYDRHPDCANIYTCALSKDRTLMRDIVREDGSGDAILTRYAMTDLGMFDLERWDRAKMKFEGTEEEMSARAASRGLKTVLSPWPSEIQIPWPAVVRKGRQVGREVPLVKSYLSKPLDAAGVDRVKSATYPMALEELCVPWGWWCLSPMYATDVTKWYYLNFRRHDIVRNGWREGRPRLVTAGLEGRRQLLTTPHRPGFARLLFRPLPSLVSEIARRLVGRRLTRSDAGV